MHRSCDAEQPGTYFLDDDDRGGSPLRSGDDEDAAVLDCVTAIVGWDRRTPSGAQHSFAIGFKFKLD